MFARVQRLVGSRNAKHGPKTGSLDASNPPLPRPAEGVKPMNSLHALCEAAPGCLYGRQPSAGVTKDLFPEVRDFDMDPKTGPPGLT